MRVHLLAFAVTAIAALPPAAHAIDCARASSPIEHMICGNSALLRADAAMGTAYAAILKAAPDPEIHAMLVTSQKRWIAARDDAFGHLDKVTDGRTGEGFSKAAQRSLVLRATQDRTKDLTAMSDKDPKQLRLIQAALKQRRFAAQFIGGPFAGFDTSCGFLPSNGGDPGYDYACFGTLQYQNSDRICGQTQDWATYRVYTSRTIADVVAGEPKLIATCKEDGCFDDEAHDTGWNTHPDAASDGIVLPKSLRKLDAEVGDEEEEPWLKACLTDKHFPQTGSLK